MAAEVPAGKIARMREERVYARLVIAAVILKFDLATLLPDGEVMLYGDCGARCVTKMKDQGIAEVGDQCEGEKAKQYSTDEALHLLLILARDGVAHGSGNSFQCERRMSKS